MLSIASISPRRLRVVAVALAVVNVLLATGAAAHASTTIGQTSQIAAPCNAGNLLVQTSTAGGPGYAVPPGGGVITSWSIQQGGFIGAMKLVIVRPLGGSQYLVVAETPPEDLFPNHFNTFSVNPSIPVQAGDLLGVVQTGGQPTCAVQAPYGPGPGDTVMYMSTGIDPPPGSTFTGFGYLDSARLNVSATVEPAPTSPPAGGASGAGGGASGASAASGASGASDGTAPALVAVGSETISPTAFRAAPAGPSAAAARPHGARVTFELNQAASVRFTTRRVLRGRKAAGGHCAMPTATNRRAPRCARLVALRGSFTRTGRTGANSFRFTGRLAGRRLRIGTYRLTATPSLNGRVGRSVSASFRITG